MIRFVASLLFMLGAQAFLLPVPSTNRATITIMKAERSQDGSISRQDAISKGSMAAVVLGGILSTSSFGGWMKKAFAAEEEAQSYVDEKYKVKFAGIPGAWQRTDTRVGAGNDPADFRKLVVYKDPKSEANIFVAYTPVQPDFATLGSFGSILDVAKTIVPTGRGVQSKLIKYESKKGYYVFDYTIQPDRQPTRHLVTIFALVPGEALVTYTASSLEDHYPEWEDTFTKVTDSFRIGG